MKPIQVQKREQLLVPTQVFDTYFHFAHRRQEAFLRRISGAPPPWTDDPIISSYRFTNPYRASDRVSQYLIREVIYQGSRDANETLFRILLFKIFNKIGTWERLREELGDLPSWRRFNLDRYCQILDRLGDSGLAVYSGAYIMPSPAFGHARKHRNHLVLLDRIMRDGCARKLSRAASLKAAFEILLAYPSFGAFLAFQYAIDINYSDLTDFSEMQFVVAGPGARDGISKCFSNAGGLTDSQIIEYVAAIADSKFESHGLPFRKLGGTRALQLIDIQNLFCEISKYARIAHPDVLGVSGRTKIKQKFHMNAAPLPQYYPPKWGLKVDGGLRATPVPKLNGQIPLNIPAGALRKPERVIAQST